MSKQVFPGLLAAVLVSLVSLSVSAQDAPEYQCTQGAMQRRVVIFYETGVAVPCEVHYFKDTEAPGEREVLWRALSQSGYCESQAAAFVAKLGSWGWACSAALPAGTAGDAGAEQETAPAPVDDTDNLAPATPGAGG